MKPMKAIADCSTGEITYVELTDVEIAQQEKDAEEWAVYKAQQDAELQAQQDAKTSAIDKLKKLGLSDAEIEALVG
jgi:exonuclease III